MGQRLTCHPGTPAGSQAQLKYAWLRDLIAIPGATSSTYTLRDVDTGHHLQCQVTATDGGGSATARSAFVTVPVQGIPASAGETSIGRARYAHGRVSVAVLCSPHAFTGCHVVLRLTVVETLSGRRVVAVSASPPRGRGSGVRRRTVTLGSRGVALARGARTTVSFPLNATGRRLLSSRHRLTATLSASGTVIGVIQSSLGKQQLRLGGGGGRASSHARAARP